MRQNFGLRFMAILQAVCTVKLKINVYIGVVIYKPSVCRPVMMVVSYTINLENYMCLVSQSDVLLHV